MIHNGLFYGSYLKISTNIFLSPYRLKKKTKKKTKKKYVNRFWRMIPAFSLSHTPLASRRSSAIAFPLLNHNITSRNPYTLCLSQNISPAECWLKVSTNPAPKSNVLFFFFQKTIKWNEYFLSDDIINGLLWHTDTYIMVISWQIYFLWSRFLMRKKKIFMFDI